jgi:hypothetical protein
MPPIRSQSSQKRVEQEGRLLLAIQAIKNQEFTSIRRATEVFDVPHSTLSARLNSIIYRADSRVNCYKLTEYEEKSLYKWIISLDNRGVAPRPNIVREVANILLKARGSTPPPKRSEKTRSKTSSDGILISLLDSLDLTTTSEHYIRMNELFKRSLTS